jgi:hypothetical protein
MFIVIYEYGMPIPGRSQFGSFYGGIGFDLGVALRWRSLQLASFNMRYRMVITREIKTKKHSSNLDA